MTYSYASRSLSLPIAGRPPNCCFFFFNDRPPTELSPLPLHAALPICSSRPPGFSSTFALPWACASGNASGRTGSSAWWRPTALASRRSSPLTACRCWMTRAGSSRPGNDDLPDVGVGFHVGLRRRQLGEGEHAVDERLDPAAREKRQEIGDEALYRGGALRGVAQLVRHAEDAQAPGVHRFQVDLASQHAVDVADDRQAALEAERADAFSEHRAADSIDRQVRAFAIGRFHHGVMEIAFARVDSRIEPH